MVALLAFFPILMLGTVIYAAFAAHIEHEAREEANSNFACCDERRSAIQEHQLLA